MDRRGDGGSTATALGACYPQSEPVTAAGAGFRPDVLLPSLVKRDFHILNVRYPRTEYFEITQQLRAELGIP